ncbi:transposase (plasmid) [Leuconostoc mesenteroides]|uniref:Transposase n=1 Tax=Leuconostoc kimchii TaxID=136609 RepID=A0ABX5SJC1_9LACO|nr:MULTISPECIES: transposase [Leuconostoc]APE77582.1 transposase [Leuconostoc mesenteroides subsp. jonggajibkimchii]AWV37858.1 transposase [Leuconostoc mesenteroides]AWV38907.1 transposase [Leuconostoc mesenteroides]MCU4665021.1 transposase [Leuconostoc mesenteroides]MCU4665889.1 transposase [Leuconostoc mesenteroides]
MKAKRYATEFKSSIVDLYNEGRSANSLANEYHLAVQTVTGWVKKAQIVGTDMNGNQVTRAKFNAMQKEIARLKEENEILKIAAVLLGEHRK